jgi:hypothetical protein
VAVGRIDRNGQHLHPVVDEVVQVVADQAKFALAGAGERERVEDQQHVLRSPKRRQLDRLVVLVLEDKVGRVGAHPDRHGHSRRPISNRRQPATRRLAYCGRVAA